MALPDIVGYSNAAKQYTPTNRTANHDLDASLATITFFTIVNLTGADYMLLEKEYSEASQPNKAGTVHNLESS